MINEKNIPTPFNYVIILKEATLERTYQEMEFELINLFKYPCAKYNNRYAPINQLRSNVIGKNCFTIIPLLIDILAINVITSQIIEITKESNIIFTTFSFLALVESNKKYEEHTTKMIFPKCPADLKRKRIIFRKCDEKTKQDIHSWIIELENNNYYDNLYLEDIVVMMNYNK